MAEEATKNENVETEENQNTDNGSDTGAQSEKKYSDEEMNSISKKNSEKAVNKVLKELGITDREKAKQILAKAAAEEAANGAADAGEQSRETQLEAALQTATLNSEKSDLSVLLLLKQVKPEKIEKAVKLIDREDYLDENGKFNKEKAEQAVNTLLKEWPELLATTEESNVGFSIGADGTESGKNSRTDKSKSVQKSWNKFNY